MAADTERMLEEAKAENIRLERELAAVQHVALMAYVTLTTGPTSSEGLRAQTVERARELLSDAIEYSSAAIPLPLDLRADYAAAADRALAHPLVIEVSEELRLNLRAPAHGLEVYGIAKVAHVAAVVSRAQAYRLDPTRLTLSGVTRG